MYLYVHLPGGKNPSGPVGRNPSKAQSSISFSSFSLFPSAAAKDLAHRSPANYRLQTFTGSELTLSQRVSEWSA